MVDKCECDSCIADTIANDFVGCPNQAKHQFHAPHGTIYICDSCYQQRHMGKPYSFEDGRPVVALTNRCQCGKLGFILGQCEDCYRAAEVAPLLAQRAALIQQLSENETALAKKLQVLAILPPVGPSLKAAHICPTCRIEQGSFFALNEHISNGSCPGPVSRTSPAAVKTPNKPTNKPTSARRARGFMFPTITD